MEARCPLVSLKPAAVYCAAIYLALLPTAKVGAAFAGSTEPTHALVERYARAVVGIEYEVTTVVSMNGRPTPPRTHKREINGTVVSRTGLTVTSVAAFDPSVVPSGPPNVHFEQTEFSGIKLRLPNGTELPGRIVHRIDALDLVFIAPDGATITAGVFAPVSFEKAAEPTLLGTYFEISLAPPAQQRASMIRRIEVAGIVAKSQGKPSYFLTSQPPSQGSPVFNAEGDLLGIGARYVGDGQTGPGLLPTSEIAAAVQHEDALSALK